MKKLKQSKTNIKLSHNRIKNQSLEELDDSIIEDIKKDVALSVLANNLEVLGSHLLDMD